MNDKLLPCPFCGGKARWTGRYVQCSDCDIRTDEYSTDYNNTAYAKAMSTWNRRTQPNEPVCHALIGVMHSVDKWLDDDELKQDEVNRAATMREKVLKIIERLQAESAQLQAERDAAVELIAKLIMLCEVPQKDCDKVFRRLHIGAGDYMGSGYAFIDAYNRILNEFLETVNEDFYKLIRCEIDLRGAKAKEESENARYI